MAGIKPTGIALALAAATSVAFAHDGSEAKAPGWVEHVGTLVPLELVFSGEQGDQVALRDVVTLPTILTLVFYHCADACPLMQANLAATLRAVGGRAGTDYRVVTVSFDANETSEQARASKAASMGMLPQGFPETAWRFLTGDDQAIEALCDAIGFHYAPRGIDFDHPLGLVILSPEGKVVRYLRGSKFAARDVEVALAQAR